jgi:hypothetical protein
VTLPAEDRWNTIELYAKYAHLVDTVDDRWCDCSVSDGVLTIPASGFRPRDMTHCAPSRATTTACQAATTGISSPPSSWLRTETEYLDRAACRW